MDKILKGQLQTIQRSANLNKELLEEAFERGFRAGYSKKETEIADYERGKREAELADITKANRFLSQ
jgi:ribosome modulation factor